MVCRYCGSEFEPKKRGRKNTGFCCKHCADNWRKRNKYDLLPEKYTKVCAQCGAEFQTNNENQKYCTTECGHASRRTGRTTYTKTCLYCEQEFQTIYKDYKYCSPACAARDAGDKRRGEYFCEYCGNPRWSDHPNRNRFCSRECATKMRVLINLPVMEERKRQRREAHQRTCPNCGKQFVANNLLRMFCSPECLYDGVLLRHREMYAEQYEPVTFVCTECGRTVTTSCGNKHRTYCSEACMNRAMNRRQKKKRQEQLDAAFVETVELWDIYNRDKGICQICGLPVPDTNEPTDQWAATVDHIIPLSKGGLHTGTNCQLAHRLCNSLKQDTTESYNINWSKKLVDEPGRWNTQIDELWNQLDAEMHSTSRPLAPARAESQISP